MKIYTKSGDDGTTQLFGGERITKSHPQVEAFGTLDELNASLGLAIAYAEPNQESIKNIIEQIQNDLFVIGGQLAISAEKWKSQIPDLNPNHILALEKWIDEASSKLPPLREFILPGGHLMASHLHLARTICRRSERVLVSAHLANSKIYICYLNRLSDTLFVAARLANLFGHYQDVPWKKS